MIERFKWVRDLGGRRLLPYRLPKLRSSTLWESGSARLPPASPIHLLSRFQAPPCEQSTTEAQPSPPIPLAEGGDVFPDLEGVNLAWTGLVRGHPPGGIESARGCLQWLRTRRHRLLG